MLAAKSVQKAARSRRVCFSRKVSSAVRSWTTATAPRGVSSLISRRVSTASDRRVLLSIHCCGGRVAFESSVSRRNAPSLLPADSIGLFRTSLLDNPKICSAVGLNQRTMAFSSVATIPGGIDLSRVSARVFCRVISSERSAFSRTVETCSARIISPSRSAYSKRCPVRR